MKFFIIVALFTAACSGKLPTTTQGPGQLPVSEVNCQTTTIFTTVHCGNEGTSFTSCTRKYTLQELIGRQWVSRNNGATITVTAICTVQ